ncbi:Receptor-like protein kinase [Senna tora]|uniref:non-specific serine/threonine protein kinase n=1 Tax=Senna tora TaxID=362788 RepID=A0A834XDB7_9FABA|nr:Receptor-like protein kinase [Senna tora]
MRHLSVLLLLLSFSSFFYSASALSSDGVALLSLRRRWTSVPPPINSTWNASHSTPCSWGGIQCDHAHNVISLNLSDYGIVGQLGPEIGHLTHLQKLALLNNGFSGKIPPQLGNCTHLEHLDLSSNYFSGQIPDCFKNLLNLEYLSLSINELTGQIPESLTQIPQLQLVELSYNSLSGPIPSSIGNMSELSLLYLQGNHLLSGEIPSSIGNCSKLKELFLNQNQFEGVLPHTLNNLHDIVYLDFADNALRGTVPLGSGSCENLFMLDLSNNVFSGGIPSGLGNCSGLTEFAAVNSGFSGSIPSSIGLLRSLSILRLPENHLSGKIPPEIGNCKSLTELTLYSNQLEGEIPSELGKLSELQDLELYSNHLTGEIPLSVWKIQSLEYILVYNNSLSGELPLEMTELKYLKNITLFNNHFSGVIPQTLGINSSLVVLDFTNNKFTGIIPPNLCHGKQLRILNLGLNQLRGSIPSNVGRCTTLTSANGLIGEIPSGIGTLMNLLSLDLSRNNLNGSIQVLSQIPFLLEINVSYNSFQGPIPKKLIESPYYSSTAFLGNPGLCISCSSSNGSICKASSYVKPCDEKSTHQKGLSKVKIAMIALGSSIFVVFLLLGLVYMFVSGGKSKQEVEISAKEGTTSLLNKVMEATANLSDRFIIGRGAHGVVYKAPVDPAQVFAVKKLAFAGNKGKNLSMVREIQTLGKIRHRNLVKLEDFWLRKDFGLILYTYMPNGSLHDVLHEKNPPPSLEWNVRYNIAIGIAHGLAYLHFDCDPPIVHRDIKPKNILLDADMEPHIADFGIAKLLDQSSASAPSISVPGTIGYIAPENAYTTANNRESDVYSYGVVLLELISRKKVVDPTFMEGMDIVSWVRTMWGQTEDIGKIVDSSLANELLDSTVLEQVNKVLQVALRSTEKDPHKRPTMRQVIRQLEDANPRTRSRKS